MTNQAKQALEIYRSTYVLPTEKDCSIDQNWDTEATYYTFEDFSELVVSGPDAYAISEDGVQS